MSVYVAMESMSCIALIVSPDIFNCFFLQQGQKGPRGPGVVVSVLLFSIIWLNEKN